MLPAPKELGEKYTLLTAGEEDFKKAVEAYQHGCVPGYDIRSVKIIYKKDLNDAFVSGLKLLKVRVGNPAFAPKWKTENESEWRGKISTLLEKMAEPYSDKDYPGVKFMPVWHGTNPKILSSLFETGFANLAPTDLGYFGKGIYSSYEADYAHRIYSQGALLMNWVAFYSAYPVIDGDKARLEGRNNYDSYDAHGAPVVAEFPDADCASYVPCKPEELPRYTEIVVFDKAQCLPRYIVELQPSLPKAPSMLVENSSAQQNLLYAFLASSGTQKLKLLGKKDEEKVLKIESKS